MKLSKIFFILHISSVLIYAKIPHKVVICGVCKDVASRVQHSMNIMEKIGNLFDDYRIIVYENNSSDRTPQILKEWQSYNNKVFALCEQISTDQLEKVLINRLDDGKFYAPEAIARARNIVLEVALSDQYQEFGYLIWMDMDFVLEPAYEGIVEVFATAKEWDAVFAYGVDPNNMFWDWYAFRDDQCPLGSELLGNDWWYLPKNLHLTRNDDWYRVYSAFGGCGIYKKSSIANCRYSALATADLAKSIKSILENNPTHPIVQKYMRDTQSLQNFIHISCNGPFAHIRNPKTGIIIKELDSDLTWRMSSFVYKFPSVCEHVTFHASMMVNGHNKLYINPRFRFFYGDKKPLGY